MSKFFLAINMLFFGKTIVIEFSSTYFEIIGFKAFKTIFVYFIFSSSISSLIFIFLLL